MREILLVGGRCMSRAAGCGLPPVGRRNASGVSAASNSGATSPIAAHSRLVLVAARGNHPHRALTQVRRISPRGTA
jgi:hypothetical protein